MKLSSQIKPISYLEAHVVRHDAPGKAEYALTRISRGLFQTLPIDLPDYRRQSLHLADC